MSGRTERLDELLREEISGVLSRDVQDPRIGFVTVTRVEVTRDLSHATVWVSSIGTPDERRDSMRGLERAMPFVRGRLAPLRLRRIPQLHVRYDESVERGTRVLRLLDELGRGEEPSQAVISETLPTPGPRPVDEPVAADEAAAGTSASAPRRRHSSTPRDGKPRDARPGGAKKARP